MVYILLNSGQSQYCSVQDRTAWIRDVGRMTDCKRILVQCCACMHTPHIQSCAVDCEPNTMGPTSRLAVHSAKLTHWQSACVQCTFV